MLLGLCHRVETLANRQQRPAPGHGVHRGGGGAAANGGGLSWVRDEKPKQVHVDVRIPASATPGQPMQIAYMGKSLRFTVPPNVAPGGLVRLPIPPHLMPTPEERRRHEEAEAEKRRAQHEAQRQPRALHLRVAVRVAQLHRRHHLVPLVRAAHAGARVHGERAQHGAQRPSQSPAVAIAGPARFGYLRLRGEWFCRERGCAQFPRAAAGARRRGRRSPSLRIAPRPSPSAPASRLPVLGVVCQPRSSSRPSVAP